MWDRPPLQRYFLTEHSFVPDVRQWHPELSSPNAHFSTEEPVPSGGTDHSSSEQGASCSASEVLAASFALLMKSTLFLFNVRIVPY